MTQAVYFVSLGAGDPELITLKALRLLERADVIYSPVSLSQWQKSLQEQIYYALSRHQGGTNRKLRYACK